MKDEGPISQRLTDYLNRFDMTIAQAAKITGLNIGTISKIINGKTRPNRRTVYKIERLIEPKGKTGA